VRARAVAAGRAVRSAVEHGHDDGSAVGAPQRLGPLRGLGRGARVGEHDGRVAVREHAAHALALVRLPARERRRDGDQARVEAGQEPDDERRGRRVEHEGPVARRVAVREACRERRRLRVELGVAERAPLPHLRHDDHRRVVRSLAHVLADEVHEGQVVGLRAHVAPSVTGAEDRVSLRRRHAV